MARLLVKGYGTAAAETFLQSCHGAAPVFLRANPTRTTPEKLLETLTAEGVTAQTTGIPGCLVLAEGTGGDLRRLYPSERALYARRKNGGHHAL